MMQLAAGIAGGDMSKGISAAGITALKGREGARDLEAKGLMLDYAGKQKDIDRRIEILGTAGRLDAMTNYYAKELARQGGMDKRSIVEQARLMVEKMYPVSPLEPLQPEVAAQRRVQMMDTYKHLLRRFSFLLGINFDDTELDESWLPESAGMAGEFDGWGIAE
jgi:hypothetical protein